jgi:hypothetical protein
VGNETHYKASTDLLTLTLPADLVEEIEEVVMVYERS